MKQIVVLYIILLIGAGLMQKTIEIIKNSMIYGPIVYFNQYICPRKIEGYYNEEEKRNKTPELEPWCNIPIDCYFASCIERI